VAYPDGIFVAGIGVASDGSVTVVMDARAGASPPPRLVRLDPRGEVDRGYGNGGRLDLTRLNGKGPVAATSEGGIVVAGTRDEGEGSAAVRVTPAGTVDGGFGAGARCRAPRPGRGTLAHAWVVFPRAGWQTAARVPARGHVTVRVAANDMAGNVRRRTFVRAVR
jgi:hypothetical protein